METKHTPGPWRHEWLTKVEAPRRFADEPNVWPILIYRAGGTGQGSEIATINHDPDVDPEDRPSEEAFANARLIAAAPDLLEACEAVVAAKVADGPWSLHPCGQLYQAIAKARAAIAKATA